MKGRKWVWISIAVVILLIAIYGIRRWVFKRSLDLDSPPILESTWDEVTDENIRGLHPEIQPFVALFVNRCQRELGITVRVYSGRRTFDEQGDLYAQGRTAPGNIVTNAEPGESYHNYGLAFDVVEIRNGQAIWENENWNEIADIAKDIGFEWGGDWFSFKDRPHFQYTYGLSVSELFAMFPNGETQNHSFLA